MPGLWTKTGKGLHIHKRTYSTRDSVYINADSSRFRLNSFVSGFHWGSRISMSKALDISGYHNASWPSERNPDLFKDTSDFFLFIPYLSCNAGAQTSLQSRGIRYEPTLLINSNYIPNLQFRPGDKNRSVFGFKNISGSITNDSNSADFQYLTLNQNGGYVSRNIPVLSENWVNNVLSTQEQSDAIPEQLEKYFGHKWHLSVNLKRGDPMDNSMGNDTVLLIT